MRGERDLLDTLAGLHVAAAMLVLIGLVAVALSVGGRPLGIPGYVVLVGFDLLQNPLAPGLTGLAFTAAFTAYVYVVAVVLGNLAVLGVRAIRTRG